MISAPWPRLKCPIHRILIEIWGPDRVNCVSGGTLFVRSEAYTQPCRLRSHHSSVMSAVKIKRNGQVNLAVDAALGGRTAFVACRIKDAFGVKSRTGALYARERKVVRGRDMAIPLLGCPRNNSSPSPKRREENGWRKRIRPATAPHYLTARPESNRGANHRRVGASDLCAGVSGAESNGADSSSSQRQCGSRRIRNPSGRN